jgi:hypothetical protein
METKGRGIMSTLAKRAVSKAGKKTPKKSTGKALKKKAVAKKATKINELTELPETIFIHRILRYDVQQIVDLKMFDTQAEKDAFHDPKRVPQALREIMDEMIEWSDEDFRSDESGVTEKYFDDKGNELKI